MSGYSGQGFHISTWTILKVVAIAIGLVVAYIVRDILVSLFLAIILASALEPAIKWFGRRKVPRILAVLIIYLLLVAAFIIFFYMVFPLFFEEFQNLSVTYPVLQKKVLLGIKNIPFLSGFQDSIRGLLQIPREYLLKVGGGVASFVSAVFGGVFSFILVIVFSFYLATQEKGIENFLRMITPVSYEPYIVNLWNRSQYKLGRWLQAQVLLGAVVGVFTFLGLTFLGVEHALFFAFLSGVFEIIPVVGPILAAVPAVITAFLFSPTLGVFTILLYTAIQQTESHLIVPIVMRRTIGLSPLIVVLALLVGAKIGGIAGVILSVPLTAILAELVDDWDKKKRSPLTGIS